MATKKRLQREIDDRKKAEKILLEERHKIQKFLDVACVIFVMIDRDQCVKLINKKGCEVLGVEEKEILGWNWFDHFVPERLRKEVKAVFEQWMKGEVEPADYFENPIVTKDHEERLIAWNNTVFRDDDGRINATLSSGQDITEKVELQKQVQQSEKLAAVGQLASGLAHEIGTPLNIIAGRAEYMLRKTEKDDINLERIIHQIERITGIVSRLLDFTRPKSLEIRSVNLKGIVENTLAFFEHQLNEKKIVVSIEFPDTLPDIQADPDQIHQVLFNIILNAIQAMSKGGRLSVKVAQSKPRKGRLEEVGDRYIRITLSDTGVGIPEDEIPRIFDPFYSTKGPDQGTGLGLSVSHAIMRSHGGRIDVKSRLGHGTEFCLLLPLDSRIQQDII